MEDQNTDTQDIHELTGKSPEFRTQLAKQLEDLVPEAIADGKVDVAKLKELLDEDAGDTNERFGLFWPGKKRAMRAAQDPTTATLKPAKELSKDWDTTENIFIEGDNLEVLKVLQKQYHNAIKMIYIDPPYNTGKDFVYPDNFKEGLQNYLEFSKQVDEGNKKISTNAETAGRYHSNWLNMMYPRLKLARNLLTDDGVIFISIDDAEQANLKKMCDEILSESNFIGTFVRRTINSGKQDSTTLADYHEYLLVYARDINKVQLNRRLKSEEERRKLYPHEDEHVKSRGRYYISQLDKGSLQYSDGLNYPILTPDGEEAWPGKGFHDKSRVFRWSKEKVRWGIENDYIVFKKMPTGWKVYAKSYEFRDNSDNVIEPSNPHTTLDFISKEYSSFNATPMLQKMFDGKNYFDFPKPVPYLRDIIAYGTTQDSTVLDFFSGSGTTAHAVMQLNAEDGGSRKHIQVQLPEPIDEKSEAYKAGYRKISDIARERINRAGEKIKANFADKLAERETPLDVGYRTYKLSDTNFTKWKSEATNDLGELQLRLDAMRNSSDDNASEEDLLVEVMLKLGLPLTARTQSRDIDGLTVHQVVAGGDDADNTTQPVFYLNEHVKPTLEQLRAIVTELTPSRFVILDDAFQGDNQLKTNLVQTCKSYDVELWTV